MNEHILALNSALLVADYEKLRTLLSQIVDKWPPGMTSPAYLNHNQLVLVTQQVIIGLLGKESMGQEALDDMVADWSLVGDTRYYLTDSMRKYIKHKDTTPSSVCLVLEAKAVYGMDYYKTFGSDALKVTRHTDLGLYFMLCGGIGIPTTAIPWIGKDHYQKEFESKGLEAIWIS